MGSHFCGRARLLSEEGPQARQPEREDRNTQGEPQSSPPGESPGEDGERQRGSDEHANQLGMERP